MALPFLPFSAKGGVGEDFLCVMGGFQIQEQECYCGNNLTPLYMLSSEQCTALFLTPICIHPSSILCRAVGARGARGAMAPPDFSRSVNPGGGGRKCPTHYRSPPTHPGYFQTFLRPSYVPSAKYLHMLELNVAKLAPIFFVKTYQNLSLKVKDCHEL